MCARGFFSANESRQTQQKARPGRSAKAPESLALAPRSSADSNNTVSARAPTSIAATTATSEDARVWRGCSSGQLAAVRASPRLQAKRLGLGSSVSSISLPSRILSRTLTVKLRGRVEAPDQSRGRTLSSRARGDTTEHHGPLQRLLAATLLSADPDRNVADRRRRGLSRRHHHSGVN
jgi:hypothetical protein